MAVVEPDGRRLEGADAIPAITRRVPLLKAFTPLFRALLAFGVLRPVYRFVARTWGPKSGSCDA